CENAFRARVQDAANSTLQRCLQHIDCAHEVHLPEKVSTLDPMIRVGSQVVNLLAVAHDRTNRAVIANVGVDEIDAVDGKVVRGCRREFKHTNALAAFAEQPDKVAADKPSSA